MLSAREKYWTGVAARCTVTLLFIYILFLLFRVIGMTFWEAVIGAAVYAGYVVLTWNKDEGTDQEEPRPRRSWAEIRREIWEDQRPRLIAIGRLVVGLFVGKFMLDFEFRPIDAVFIAASVPVLLGLYVTREWE